VSVHRRFSNGREQAISPRPDRHSREGLRKWANMVKYKSLIARRNSTLQKCSSTRRC
jgi:hypothetical protein